MKNSNPKIKACKLLCDPTRFEILSILLPQTEGMCVYEIADAVDMSHSATSHQLAKLEAHEVVSSYASGQTVCYRFREDSEIGGHVKQIITY